MTGGTSEAKRQWWAYLPFFVPCVGGVFQLQSSEPMLGPHGHQPPLPNKPVGGNQAISLGENDVDAVADESLPS